ncbi:MAG: hypothetical protein FJ296_03945 [Planctomycetes bacterium]|nr:hypothetical protein [Planctomycetota bacterium]
MTFDHLFRSAGLPARTSAPGPHCLTDEALAGYAQGLLPEREHDALLSHALRCAPCHELVGAVATAVGIRRPATAPALLRIVARLARNGLQLLNEAELALGALVFPPVPALGAVRRAPEASRDLLVFRGPGGGLDEIEVQMQANGTARLGVRAVRLPSLKPEEILSVLLEVDGAPREKRPYTGDMVHFAPLGAGSYRVRVTARAPGEPARDLAEATLELKG